MTKVDLSIIPDTVVRWRADEDFRIAKECRERAHFYGRHKTPGWRLDHRLELRRAIRAWKHYATAVRGVS